MTVFDAWTLDTELIELAKKLLQDLVQFCTDFSVRFDIKDSSWQQCNGATVNGDGQDTSTYKCKLKQNYHQSQWWLAENATNVCAKMQKSDKNKITKSVAKYLISFWQLKFPSEETKTEAQLVTKIKGLKSI